MVDSPAPGRYVWTIDAALAAAKEANMKVQNEVPVPAHGKFRWGVTP